MGGRHRSGLLARATLLLAVFTAGTHSEGALFPDPSIPEHSRTGSHRNHGLKKALFMVVHDENEPYSPSQWNSIVASTRNKELGTREFYAENSGGAFDIYYEDILDIAIPLNADGTRPSNFWSIAQGIATTQYGKNLSDYYMFAYDVSDTGRSDGQGWGGLSTSNRIYLQSTSTRLINHEIGHQVGADHAKSFVARNSGVYHTYTWNEASSSYEPYIPGVSPYDPLPFGVASIEYGNPFDTMANGTGHFRIREKLDDLDWLTNDQVPRLDGAAGLGPGDYRIYAHDELVATTNAEGEYGVQDGYNPNVLYGLTYQRLGQVFNTTLGRFIAESQTIDIEYRSNADGAVVYLNGTIVDLDPQSSTRERLLEVGNSVEDTEFGMSRFSVNAGAINQVEDDIDFLSFNPDPPVVLAAEWFHLSALSTGVDSIGSYIDLRVTAISALNDLQGDLDQNGSIDTTDYYLYLAGWMHDTSSLSSLDKYRSGDLNLDGENNIVDLHLFRDAWLAAGNSPTALLGLGARTPEPGGLSLLCLGGLLALARQRKQR